MRILLLCEAFRSIGGVQEVVDNLAAELAALGNDVAILSTPFVAGEPRTIRFSGECRYVGIPSRRPVTLRHPERLLRLPLSLRVRELSNAIADFRPTVVSSHCWSWDQFPAVVAACQRAHLPLVHSLFDSWGSGTMGTAALSALRGAAALTALSEATRRFFEPLLPEARDARVIIGGVDPTLAEASVPMPHPHPYIFCAARLDIRHKAIDSLIEAFASIASEHREVDLLISGGGRDRESLEALAISSGVADRVKFLGIVPRAELWSLYKGATIYAMPSRMPEGLGLVFLEAMAAGIPVIGTRSGGTPEIVEHELTGLLIGENNSPAELAAAMIRLLRDPEMRRQMGQHARERVASRYSWRQFAGQYLEVFASCSRGGV
ncbi:MAG TPA: glycosyltransferase family 4 protein [Candidatus Binataceae bacterium]|nr:glycosyltransferase family 4 protein [Candidatus Binataceae bacterium]